MFENLVSQECRKTHLHIAAHQVQFENLVSQECRKTELKDFYIYHMFENLVSQECRKTLRRKTHDKRWFENLVNQECRTLNIYICNQILGESPQPTKLKYGESSQTPQREFTSESDRHVNEPILSINNLKVNTNTMTPTNQGVFL